MALKILDDCISCAACEPVCPTEAIFEGDVICEIDADKCVECEGHFDTNQCVDVCPVEVFEMVDEKSSPVNAEECLGCESCVEVCEEDAITVEET